MKLSTEAVEKALGQLEKNICFYEKKSDPEIKESCRTAAIKNFELTYELLVKQLFRQLKAMGVTAGIDQMSFKDLVRAVAEKKFIDDPTVWFSFKESRNLTVHTYQEETAEKVYKALPNFAKEARLLIKKLKDYNKKHDH